jgi:hypothetical protein
LWAYGQHFLEIDEEKAAEGGSSKVGYVLQVDDERKILVELASPSVMKKVGDLLPRKGIELTWARDQSLLPKILAKVSTLLSSPTALTLMKYV